MSLWRHLTRGMRVLTNRTAADEDLADELRDYVDEATADLIAQGLSPDEARRRARSEVGNPLVVREQVRSHGWEHFTSDFLGDVRYAVRQLRSHRGFALTAILILGLGIGASTAIFSAVNPILFKSLPYPHSDRLMTILEMKGGGSRLPSFGTFTALSQQSHSFDSMAVMKGWRPSMVGVGEPEFFSGQRVSADYFRTLGVEPALGRDFQTSDDRLHGPNVLIISDRLWHRRFAGDPNIIGRAITLETSRDFDATSSYTVIGVMPAGFDNVLSPNSELWAPLQYDSSLPDDGKEWGHHLQMIARLQPGVSREQAAGELDALLPAFGRLHTKGFEGAGGVPQGVVVASLHDNLIADVKPALLAILGAVALVLLIACVNVANLSLARAAQRRGEFAMRAALGARQVRLLRQLITESLLLALVGGVLGIAVAEIGVRALVALSPPGLPRVNAIRVDTAVLLFTFAITTLVGVVVGLVPALQLARSDPQSSLKQSSRHSAGGNHIVRRSLVISEVALALVLLCSAGLLLRSLQRLFSIDPGFDATHLLTMEVQESGARYINDDARARFFDQALEAVRHVPGVESAAFVNQVPLSGDFDTYGIEYQALPHQQDAAFRYGVSPDYFATMHIPLRRGRFLNEHDREQEPVAVLISESLAKRRFRGLDPIGQRVRMGPEMGSPTAPWRVVVGVVGDVRQMSLGAAETDAFYTTSWAWTDNVQSVIVRTRGDAGDLAPAVRRAIWSVDKDVPIIRTATMGSLVEGSEAERRFALILFECFACVGLILAATGIYGVLAASVAERTREIGVRSALGAPRSSILALIVRQGMAFTGIGIALGLLGALAASQALTTLLFGVSKLDPITYLGVLALLLIVSVVASSLPAWRAARVDPAITLRAE